MVDDKGQSGLPGEPGEPGVGREGGRGGKGGGGGAGGSGDPKGKGGPGGSGGGGGEGAGPDRGPSGYFHPWGRVKPVRVLHCWIAFAVTANTVMLAVILAKAYS